MAKSKSKVIRPTKSEILSSLSTDTKAALAKRPPNKQKFVVAKLAGNTNQNAAVLAGFSASTGRVATRKIVDPETATVLKMAMRDRMPVVVGVIDDALKATQTFTNVTKEEGYEKVEGQLKKFSRQKVVSTEVVDHHVRLKAAGMAAKFAGEDEGGDINNFGPTQFIFEI